MKTSQKTIGAIAVAVAACSSANASSDYGPAIWNPACSGHWYTSGNGHKFHVCHDMEGYYLSTISYFQNCGTSASVHYCVNGKQDTSTDHAAGEITQMVLEAYYAWHVLCWNTYTTGTEHEGFASNPAWYTTAMYNASAPLSAHLASKFGFAKDRNHIVGHNEWQNANWRTYATANFGINASCNTHTDPGPYWDWVKYMSIVNPTSVIVDNGSANFTASANWSTGTSATDKYGADYRFRSTAAISDPAQFNTSFGSAGTHTVYVWYPEGSNRSTTTPFIISTSAGDHTETVNQQITGGQWVNQGSYSMNSGANYVKVSCWTTTGFVVVADAVQWQ